MTLDTDTRRPTIGCYGRLIAAAEPRRSASEGVARNMRAEISYHLVMDDDMEFVEGTYRLPGGDWQVVIVSRRDVSEPEVVPQVWESGVTGVFVRFPCRERLNQAAVERVLSAALGVAEWVPVRGPDSINLR